MDRVLTDPAYSTTTSRWWKTPRKIFKGFLVCSVIGCFAAFCSIFKFFFRTERTRRRFHAVATHYFCIPLVWLLDVRTSIKNLPPREGRNRLLVSNHLSYLDVLIFAAIHPVIFITSVEVEKAFFLGTITRCAGCLFVERRSKNWLVDEIEDISQVLRDGLDVVIFPEGTTSNGETVLPFKGSLLAAAKNAMVDIQPMCLNYREIDGEPVNPLSRDSVYYYGSMEFGEHFNRLLSLHSIQAEVTFLPKMTVAPETCRKELTRTAHQAVRRGYEGVE